MNNNILKSSFALKHKLSVIIPGTVDINQAADTSAYVDKAALLLSGLAGGATSTPAVGYWRSPALGLVRENNTIVFAYVAESILESVLDKLVSFAVEMRDALKQEAIAVELDGAMYFI